jgi:hypothetical protein
VIDLTGDEPTDTAVPPVSEQGRVRSFSRTRINPALGGGQEVRICNPCVPDPNIEPPRPPPPVPRDARTGPTRNNFEQFSRDFENAGRMGRALQRQPSDPYPSNMGSGQVSSEYQPGVFQHGLPRDANLQGVGAAGRHGRALSAQEAFMGLGPSGVRPMGGNEQNDPHYWINQTSSVSEMTTQLRQLPICVPRSLYPLDLNICLLVKYTYKDTRKN